MLHLELFSQFKFSMCCYVQTQEMRQLIQQGINMEIKYTHMFDELIIFTNQEEAYQHLLTTCQRLKEQFQWVPSTWVKR